MVEPPMISHWSVNDPYDYVKKSRDNKIFFITDEIYGNIVVKYPIGKIENLFHELRVYKKLLTVERNPRICYPLFVNDTIDKALVFPYCGTPLVKMRYKLSKSQLYQIFIDIADALQTIFLAGILYFDLHDLNVLVDDNNRGVLIDFDSSEFMDSEKYPLKSYETFDRYPPEAWTTDYDDKLDIYCFGHLLQLYLPELATISRMCMDRNPVNRPSIEIVKQKLLSVKIF